MKIWQVCSKAGYQFSFICTYPYFLVFDLLYLFVSIYILQFHCACYVYLCEVINTILRLVL